MLKKENIKMVLETVRSDWDKASEKDIAFAILCDAIEDKTLAYRLAYRRSDKDADSFYKTPRFKKLLDTLEPFGIGSIDSNSITKEQNKGDLIKLLARVQALGENGGLEVKDALKLEGDLRVKLNDKFEMEESQKQKRIIVVPSKHDIVCPMTRRECNFWPTRKACVKHFGLIDPQDSEAGSGKAQESKEDVKSLNESGNE